MQHKPRPLIPINLEGNDEVARALLNKKCESLDISGKVTNPLILQNPHGYIQVPQFNLVIATRETLHNKNIYDTLDSLADQGQLMPSPTQFTRHWLNTKEATEGKRKLLYADGTPVSEDASKDLWGYMSSTDRSPWNNKICWTWLNALFKDGNIYTKLKTSTDSQGKKSLIGSGERLKDYVGKTVWVNLDFNDQGMPIGKSSSGSYIQGKNIRFYKPGDGTVARFGADSSRAYLNCDGSPDIHSTSLGVFACAEGTASQNLGGEK